MRRNQFVRSCIAAGAVLMAPVSLLAGTARKFREKTGFFVGAGKGRLDKKISLFEGDTFTTKVSTTDTDGDVYIYESVRVKEGGPAHHLHFEQDECWYVLQGQFIIKVGEQVFHASTGDTVFGPRMVPHSFAKVGEGEGKLLMVFQPAGKMEECFQKISEGVLKGMSEDEQEKFREAHGFKRVGPPIKDLKWQG